MALQDGDAGGLAHDATVPGVKPHELIHELVTRAGGELPVAKAMGQRSFQGTLYKFTHGQVASPDRRTAEKIAKHFALPVDALYDEGVATRIAAERLGTGAGAASTPPLGYSAEALEIAQIYDAMTNQRFKRVLYAHATAYDERRQERENDEHGQ